MNQYTIEVIKDPDCEGNFCVMSSVDGQVIAVSVKPENLMLASKQIENTIKALIVCGPDIFLPDGSVNYPLIKDSYNQRAAINVKLVRKD